MVEWETYMVANLVNLVTRLVFEWGTLVVAIVAAMSRRSPKTMYMKTTDLRDHDDVHQPPLLVLVSYAKDNRCSSPFGSD